jgi:hypothetical protein
VDAKLHDLTYCYPPVIEYTGNGQEWEDITDIGVIKKYTVKNLSTTG